MKNPDTSNQDEDEYLKAKVAEVRDSRSRQTHTRGHMRPNHAIISDLIG